MSARLPFVSGLLGLLVALPALAADDVVQRPEPDSMEATVQRLLQAGVDGDFRAYLAEIHPDKKESKDQQSSLQRYEWKRFSVQASWYLLAAKPLTFQVSRRVQVTPTKHKLFLRDTVHADSMPRPVELTRHQDKWVVSSNSL
jgi:hypothetical protein